MSAEFFGFNTTQADTLARMKTAVAGGVADNAVSTVKLQNSAVTTAKIADANVTAAKIAALTSAQLRAIISDETGTGAAVFATSPTFVTPILGVPTSGTLTNCTGLPVAGTAGHFSGAQTTRAAVRAEVGDSPAIGSAYFSSAGKLYIKVTNVPGDTDWQRVTTSAAD